MFVLFFLGFTTRQTKYFLHFVYFLLKCVSITVKGCYTKKKKDTYSHIHNYINRIALTYTCKCILDKLSDIYKQLKPQVPTKKNQKRKKTNIFKLFLKIRYISLKISLFPYKFFQMQDIRKLETFVMMCLRNI